MPYTDANSIDNPTTGQPIPAAFHDQIRTNQEFFASPPQCSVYASGAQSVNDSSSTILTADSENYDTDTMHSTASNTSRITCVTAGKYLFWGTVSFASDVDGYRRVNYKLNNGTAVTLDTREAVDSAAISTVISVVFTLTLVATDYVEIEVAHTAGAALNVTLREFGAVWQSR